MSPSPSEGASRPCPAGGSVRLGKLLAVILSAGTLACAGASSGAGKAGAAAPAGSTALDISLPDVNGDVVEVTTTQDDEIFLLVFWATWCQPCQQELSKLGPIHAERVERGLRVYAISIDGPDTAAQVGPWVQREGYAFPVLLDRETRILGRYNPRGDIPFYVVLDARGGILKDHQGYVTGDMDELATFLDGVMRPG